MNLVGALLPGGALELRRHALLEPGAAISDAEMESVTLETASKRSESSWVLAMSSCADSSQDEVRDAKGAVACCTASLTTLVKSAVFTDVA